MARVRTRCKYCGAKLVEEYGLKWCSRPCSLGALEKDIYEQENHLGPYAPTEDSTTEETTEDSTDATETESE